MDDDMTDEMLDAYQEWLMHPKQGLIICNGDMLVNHVERQTMVDEFLEEYGNGHGTTG